MALVATLSAYRHQSFVYRVFSCKTRSCLDKRREQRMPRLGSGSKFGMELEATKPGMLVFPAIQSFHISRLLPILRSRVAQPVPDGEYIHY